MGKRRVLDRTITVFLWIAAVMMGVYLLCAGYALVKEKVLDKKEGIWEQMYLSVQEWALEYYMPGLLHKQDTDHVTGLDWIWERVTEQIPFFLLEEDSAAAMASVESPGMYEKIAGENSRYLQEKIREENLEAGPAEENLENTGDMESMQAEADAQGEADVPAEADVSAEVNVQTEAQPVMEDIPLEKFQDYDFVINSYFTVDQTTTISSEQLNGTALVTKDLRMTTTADQPQILIYHTHSQEAFADSRDGETADTVVGVGEYLTSLLQDTYGYQVIHVTDVFDVVDGSLDRSKAYSIAREKISRILEENPSIEVVIDLHRDGVAENRHLVTDLNGKPTAQIMFFNGLSRTTKNGDISSLPNPYIEDNLAFSLQLHLMADKYYPGLARTIYLKGYRYNLHLRPKSLLVECGAQTNTVEEERNAMEPLADILDKVLKGE
ncbi:MAG: stage II sporulation protein P [Lachnospiraceae bacterium]